MIDNTCGTIGCPGHGPGAFDSCVAEALHEWVMDGGGEYTYPHCTDACMEDCGCTSVVVFDVESDEVCVVDGRDVTVPAGAYEYFVDAQGFVYVEHFTSRDVLRAVRGILV